MIILAIDTSTKSCGVAIIKQKNVVTEVTHHSNKTHSRHILGLIDKALDISDIKTGDLSGFAICNGPGSFTGLRIGLSIVKGLATVNRLPVAGVSSLDALAKNIPFTTATIIPIIDARKEEVYTAQYRYDCNGNLIKISAEIVTKPEKIVENIKSRVIFVGSGVNTFRSLFIDSLGENACFPGESFDMIRASTVGLIGFELLNVKSEHTSTDIIPNYIRKSDAEINHKKK